MFINFTNHPSHAWDERQTEAARQYGEIVDLQFPNISPAASASEIRELADEYRARILAMGRPEDLVVHIQGEQTFCYALIRGLQGEGVRCVASCTERLVHTNEIGEKVSVFRFSGFRDYSSLCSLPVSSNNTEEPEKYPSPPPFFSMAWLHLKLKEKDTYSAIALFLLIVGEIFAMLWVRRGWHVWGWATIVNIFLIFCLFILGRCNGHRFFLRSQILSKLLNNAIVPRWLGTVYLILFIVHLGWLDGAALSFFLEDSLLQVFYATLVCLIAMTVIVVFLPNGREAIEDNAQKVFISGISTIGKPRDEASYSSLNLIPLVRILQLMEEGDRPCKMLILLSDGYNNSEKLTNILRSVMQLVNSEAIDLFDKCISVEQRLELLIREVAKREFREKAWLESCLEIEFTAACDYSRFDTAYKILDVKLQTYDDKQHRLYFNATPGTSIISSLMTLMSIDSDRELYYYSQKKMPNEETATEQEKLDFRADLLQPVDKTTIPLNNLLSQALEKVR